MVAPTQTQGNASQACREFGIFRTPPLTGAKAPPGLRTERAFATTSEVEAEFGRSRVAFHVSTPYRAVIALHAWEERPGASRS